MSRSYKKLYRMSKAKKTPRGGRFPWEPEDSSYGNFDGIYHKADHAKKFPGNRVNHNFCEFGVGIKRVWKKLRNRRMRRVKTENIPVKKDKYAIAWNVD